MTFGTLFKSILSFFIVSGILLGLCFMGFEFLLYGEGRATFFGYQITTSHTAPDGTYCRIGDAVIIKSAEKCEIHNDTPIAVYDKNSKIYYVYRVVRTEKDNYVVSDNFGSLIYVPYKDIAGRVIEI